MVCIMWTNSECFARRANGIDRLVIYEISALYSWPLPNVIREGNLSIT